MTVDGSLWREYGLHLRTPRSGTIAPPWRFVTTWSHSGSRPCIESIDLEALTRATSVSPGMGLHAGSRRAERGGRATGLSVRRGARASGQVSCHRATSRRPGSGSVRGPCCRRDVGSPSMIATRPPCPSERPSASRRRGDPRPSRSSSRPMAQKSRSPIRRSVLPAGQARGTTDVRV